MWLFRLVLFSVVVGLALGMTRAQLKKTMKIMKTQCMPKEGVTEAQVGNIEQGVFLEDHNVMCYIACVYKTIQVVKNNKLDLGLISKQIDVLYPPELKEPVKKGAAQCTPLQDNYSDMCEGIFRAAKCLYDYDPSMFIFP